MPRFAANLAYLFTERPLIERFAAAAAAGFKAVELQFPYDHAPSAIKAEIDKHGLTQLGINTVARRPARAMPGSPPCPGASATGRWCSSRRSTTTVAIGGSAIHCMAGMVPPEQRPAAERTFIANITRAADLARTKNVTILIEPINPRDRPNYFLTRVEQAADLIAKVGKPNVKIQYDFYHVQIVSGDLHQALREAPAAHRPCADRGGAVARRAGRGRDQLSRTCSRRSTGSAGRAGSRANTAPRRAPRTGSAGAGRTGLGPARMSPRR